MIKIKAQAKDKAYDFPKLMKRRYFLASGFLIVLVFASFVLLQKFIKDQQVWAVVINISGRQRMLSQRIAFFSLRLVFVDEKERADLREKLSSMVDLMKKSHRGLTMGDPKMNLPRELSPEVRAMYFGEPLNLDAKVGHYLEDAKIIVNTKDEDLRSDSPSLYRLITGTSEILDGLDQVVWQLQKESESLNKRLRFISLGLFTSILLGIFFVVFRICYPLTRRIQESLEKIKKSEEEKAKILQSIGDGVVVIDRSWNIMLFNFAAEKISGWQEKEVIGKNLREVLGFIRVRDREENISFIEKAFVLGKTHYLEDNTVLVTKDGREVPVGDSASPIFGPDGKIIGAVVIFRDITKEKEAQMLKSDFAYASHQLRTPVNEALWNLEVALGEMVAKKTKEKIQTAYQSIRNILRLNSELIEVSEIDQGIVIPKKGDVKLADLFEEIFKSIDKVVKDKRVKIISSPISAATAIKTDAKLFKRVMRVILDNAIFYSAPKSEVKVDINIKDRKILVEISDRGIGVPEVQQPLVFTKFFRGSNVPTEVTGAGLGLYIAREYVKLLKGKIWFKSEEKKGTTFSVLLPISNN
jgi:PAS domain S-box-containing protein